MVSNIKVLVNILVQIVLFILLITWESSLIVDFAKCFFAKILPQYTVKFSFFFLSKSFVIISKLKRHMYHVMPYLTVYNLDDYDVTHDLLSLLARLLKISMRQHFSVLS